MVKIGLIGLGGISGAHIAAYRRYPDVEIACAADGKGKEAYSFSMLPESTRLYTDYKEMIEREELDAVDICAPSHLHREITVYALNHGLHVLCEKPMALTSEDAEIMVSEAKKSGKALMVAQIIRFSKPYAYLRELVRGGELGRPVHVFMNRLSSIPRWRLGANGQNAAANGGVMLDLSIHDVDMIYSVFGEPNTVKGIYHCESAEDPNDYYSAALGYDGFEVVVSGGFYEAEIAFTREFYAIFEKGDLRLDRSGKLYRSGEELDVCDIVYKGEIKGLNIELTSVFVEEMGRFIECVKTGMPCETALPESTAGGIKLAKRILDEMSDPV